MPPFPAHYASFFLCCVCISLDTNASFEGGYTAFLPPSPSSIVTCHPRFIVVKCLRYDAPPLRPLSNGQIPHCDNIVPQQLIVVLFACPLCKDIPNVYSALLARKPICALPMRPPPLACFFHKCRSNSIQCICKNMKNVFRVFCVTANVKWSGKSGAARSKQCTLAVAPMDGVWFALN